MNILPIVYQAGALALKMQDEVFDKRTKPDGSLVTQVDEAIEKYLGDSILELYPDDGLNGEEGYYKASRSKRTWTIDPIDGSVQFIRNQEFWSILVGLDDDQGGKIGILFFPAREELVYASRGNGCWEEKSGSVKQLKVSQISDLNKSYLLHNGVEFARQAGHDHDLARLAGEVYAERGYADAFGHMEVARGRSDIMVDFLTEYHDIAPVRVAISEAGGEWSALDGTQDLSSGGCITSNGLLHASTISHFKR